MVERNRRASPQCCKLKGSGCPTHIAGLVPLRSIETPLDLGEPMEQLPQADRQEVDSEFKAHLPMPNASPRTPKD
jgi:hypothetical protein